MADVNYSGKCTHELWGPTLKSSTLPLPHHACVLLPAPLWPQNHPLSPSLMPLKSPNSSPRSSGSLTFAGRTSPPRDCWPLWACWVTVLRLQRQSKVSSQFCKPALPVPKKRPSAVSLHFS